MNSHERAAAFWARMARCQTVDRLERDFASQAKRQGAPKATVEALMFCLRERGVEALAEADNQRRLGDMSSPQIAEAMERIAKWPGRYPGSAELLDALAEIIEAQP